MTYNVRQSGAWVAKNTLSVKQSGSMVAKSVAYVRVSGAWVNFLTQLVALTTRTISVSGTGSSQDCSLLLDSTGQAYENKTGTGSTAISGQWRLSGSSSDYDVRWTPVSGTPNYLADPVNTWLNLGTSRRWGWNQTTVGTTNVVGTVEIRLASSGAILATATITLSATRT